MPPESDGYPFGSAIISTSIPGSRFRSRIVLHRRNRSGYGQPFFSLPRDSLLLQLLIFSTVTSYSTGGDAAKMTGNAPTGAGSRFHTIRGPWLRAFKMVTQDDESPLRAAAGLKLATDIDPKSSAALAKAAISACCRQQDLDWKIKMRRFDLIPPPA